MKNCLKENFIFPYLESAVSLSYFECFGKFSGPLSIDSAIKEAITAATL